MAILAVGEKYHHFKIDGKCFQAGLYDYMIKDGRLTIWKGDNNSRPVVDEPIAAIIDQATGVAFANEAAIHTWMGANFFF